jgi:hypothetical protein
MKKIIAAAALAITATGATAHEYNQGGFEIDAFYTDATGWAAHVELTVHESLSQITCRIMDSNGKPVASETLRSYNMTPGWNKMMILYREGADVDTVRCQSRK